MPAKATKSETQRIPKLRFSGFSGEWEANILEDIVKNYGGTSLEEYAGGEGSHKFISIGNYSTSGRYIDNGQKVILNKKTKTKLLEKNDLVMVLNDKTLAGDIIGSTILINQDNSFIYNQRSERLVVDNKKATPNFLWLLLNSRSFRRKVFKISQGGTQIYVNFPAVKRLKMNLPTIPEQQKIAEFLGSADELINNLKEQKENLEFYKKGAMQKIFSQEIRFKDEKGKNFQNWDEKNLGDIIKFLSDYTANGSFASLKENVKYYSSKNYAALLRTTDLEKESFIPERFTDKKGYDFLKKTSLFGGELILSNVGYIGKIFRAPKYDGLMTLAPNTYVLKFKENIDENYMYQWMLTNGFAKKIIAMVGGGGLKAINKASLRSIKLSLPIKEEQQKIADFLISIDKVIESKQQQVSEVEQWKSGLMQQLFI